MTAKVVAFLISAVVTGVGIYLAWDLPAAINEAESESQGEVIFPEGFEHPGPEGLGSWKGLVYGVCVFSLLSIINALGGGM